MLQAYVGILKQNSVYMAIEFQKIAQYSWNVIVFIDMEDTISKLESPILTYMFHVSLVQGTICGHFFLIPVKKANKCFITYLEAGCDFIHLSNEIRFSVTITHDHMKTYSTVRYSIKLSNISYIIPHSLSMILTLSYGIWPNA